METDQWRVEWSEVADAANRAFSIWAFNPELAWAERTWRALSDRGFADYTDELQRHVVLLRFLALGGIYVDFSRVAWDETTPERDYRYWAEPLWLDNFAMGRLYERLPNAGPLDGDNFGEALAELVEAERPTLVKALIANAGAARGLYESLWSSRRCDGGGSDAAGDHDDENDGGVFVITGIFEGDDPWFPATASRASALSWVERGCRIGDW